MPSAAVKTKGRAQHSLDWMLGTLRLFQAFFWRCSSSEMRELLVGVKCPFEIAE
jgi:hypothetical protein